MRHEASAATRNGKKLTGTLLQHEQQTLALAVPGSMRCSGQRMQRTSATLPPPVAERLHALH